MNLRNHLVKAGTGTLFLFAFFQFATAADIVLPAGWRLPTKEELSDDWREKDSRRYSVVEGDFNGDGTEDKATLLVSRGSNRLRLFVFLSRKNHTFKPYILNEMKASTDLQAMGIAKVLPGKYKTACGKGYWKCKENEIPEISIAYDAIDFFKTESTNSYFYWDKRKRIFRRIWISD